MSIFDIFRSLQAGQVVGKNHYSASGLNRENMTSFNRRAAEVAVFTAAPVISESWSLVVRGTDKSGKHRLIKEIYVDEMTWNNTPMGSAYTRARSAPTPAVA